MGYANDLTHVLRFGPKFRVAEHCTQGMGNDTGPGIRQGKTDQTIARITWHALPKIADINRHKGRLGLLAKQSGNGIVFNHRVRSYVGDEVDLAPIPSRNIMLNTPTQQLFIQYNHPTGSSVGRVSRNCSVIKHAASRMAARETRPW